MKKLFSSPNYIFQTQRFIAIAILVVCLTGIISNLIADFPIGTKVFNIVTTIFFIPIALFSFLLDKKAMRIIQCFVITIVGILTVLSRSNLFYQDFYIGEFMIIIAILLFYVYQIINKPHWLHYLIYFVLFLLIKFYRLNPDETSSFDLISKLLFNSSFIANYLGEVIVSTFLIIFIINISKKDIINHLNEIQKKELFIRVGINASALLHHLKLRSEKYLINFILEDLNKDKIDSLKENASVLKNLIYKKDKIRENILRGISMQLSSDAEIFENVSIYDILNTILEIYSLDEKVFGKVYFNKIFLTHEIFINGVYAEIYMLFQNIIANALESMIQKNNQHHTLTIDTSRIIIDNIMIISDTGKGFDEKTIDQTDKINLTSIFTKKQNKGFGLFYIYTIINKYNGNIEYYNIKTGGTKAIIKLPYQVKG